MGWRRCKARKLREAGDEFWGRCDLDRGHAGYHELERGFMSVTWPSADGGDK